MAKWTAFGNLTFTDCTVAAEAELIEIWDALGHRTLDLTRLDAAVARSWKQVKRLPVLSLWSTTIHWQSHPMDGVRPVSWRTFFVTQRGLLESAVRRLGAVEVTMAPPKKLFDPPSGAGSWPPPLWTLKTVGGRRDPTEGHAAIVAGFGPTGVVLVTWGRTYEVTWSWLDRYGDYALAIVPSLPGGR